MKNNFIIVVMLLLISITLPCNLLAQDGSLDLTFDNDGVVNTRLGVAMDYGNAVTLQVDGKIVVAGKSNNNFAVVRYNANGSLDTTFDSEGKVTTPLGTGVSEGFGVAIQADGKIVVVGRAKIGLYYDFAVVRYNTNGSLDTSFDTDGIVTTPIRTKHDEAYAVAIQSDGKIVVAGSSDNASSLLDFAVVRYNTDGSLDTTFAIGGKVLTDIFNGDIGYSVTIQADGKILVAGQSQNGSFRYFAVVRYNTDGSLDTTFDADGKVTTAVGSSVDKGCDLVIQADGKILVAGLSNNGSIYDWAVVRYNTNGSLDNTFDVDGKVTTPMQGNSFTSDPSLTLQADGKILVAGHSFNGSNYDFALVRYNTNGSLDTSFDSDGKVTTNFGTSSGGSDVTIQPDGKILISGGTSIATNISDVALARYNLDGSLDTSFDTDGKVTTSITNTYSYGNAVAMQADGKILVAGRCFYSTSIFYALVRYNIDGSLDFTTVTSVEYGDDYGMSLVVQADGKILAAGYSFNGSNNDFTIVRYNSNGSLDTSFDLDGKVTTPIGTGNDEGFALVLQTDGKIIVAGQSYNGVNYDFAVVRYNTDGSLDTSFSSDGKVTTPIGVGNDEGFGAVIQPDGKIVVVGRSYSGSDNNFAVVRYNTDGSLDATFDTDGKATTAIGNFHDEAFAIVLQTDGKIVVVGRSRNGSYNDFAIARYNTNGSLDATFDNDGKVTTAIGNGNDEGYSVVVQPDGKILVAGMSNNGSDYDVALIRYNYDGSIDNTFDSDGVVTTAIGSGHDEGFGMTLQPDGKIVVAGQFVNGNNLEIAVMRYNNDNTVDTKTSNNQTTEISLFPNPSNEILNILLPKKPDKMQIQIVNSLGILVQKISVNESTQINTSNLSDGIYFIQLTQDNNIISNNKLIVCH